MKALIEGTEAEPAVDVHPSWAAKQSSGVQQDQGLDMGPLLPRKTTSTYIHRPLPISISTTTVDESQFLTPSSFRPLPQTGPQKGRHPRQGMEH